MAPQRRGIVCGRNAGRPGKAVAIGIEARWAIGNSCSPILEHAFLFLELLRRNKNQRPLLALLRIEQLLGLLDRHLAGRRRGVRFGLLAGFIVAFARALLRFILFRLLRFLLVWVVGFFRIVLRLLVLGFGFLFRLLLLLLPVLFFFLFVRVGLLLILLWVLFVLVPFLLLLLLGLLLLEFLQLP